MARRHDCTLLGCREPGSFRFVADIAFDRLRLREPFSPVGGIDAIGPLVSPTSRSGPPMRLGEA